MRAVTPHMRWGMLVGLGLVVQACAVPFVPDLEQPIDFDEPETHTVTVDGAFSLEERAALEDAVDLWRTETGGRLSVELVDEGGEVAVLRGPSGSTSFARIDRLAREVRIDADGLAAAGFDLRAGLFALSANALGIFAGMPKHGECGILGADCVEPTFTAADRASCVAAGACR